jgi:hypothetical protein
MIRRGRRRNLPVVRVAMSEPTRTRTDFADRPATGPSVRADDAGVSVQ